MSATSRWSGLLFVFVGVCGCSDMERPYPVGGKVTLQNGDILPHGGMIVFRSKENGSTANGVIQTDGSYEMTTFEAGDGVIPGSYQAVVTAAISPKWNEDIKGPPPRVIARKYQSFETSELEYSTLPKDNVIDISLDGP